ncbi:hypothetical protein F1735_17380, partial [Massilia sp. CCM 8694]|nr:hypothetical protein [Massilia genomosp. 1]
HYAPRPTPAPTPPPPPPPPPPPAPPAPHPPPPPTPTPTPTPTPPVEVAELVLPQLPVIAPVPPVVTRAASPLQLTIPPPVPGTGAQRGLGAQAKEAITVSLVRASSKQVAGLVAVGIPKEIIASGERFSIALPKQLSAAMAVGGVSVQVTRTDASPLPGWLAYNAQTQSFDVSAAPAGALPFEVLIVVDGQRWTMVLTQTGQ